MKKITIFAALLLVISNSTSAQCTTPASVPYVVNTEAVTIPALPDCMYSTYSTFSSSEIFKTVSGPIAGFDGNVLAYNTTINTEFGAPSGSVVMAHLYTANIEMVQGTAYRISYKFANSAPQFVINNMEVRINNNGTGNILLASHDNITGATPTIASYVYTPTATGSYAISFTVNTPGTQGLLYLDDIAVREEAAMSVPGNTLNAVTAYPNPVKDILNIDTSISLEKAELYTISGQLVMRHDVMDANVRINIEKLQAGVYFVKLYTGKESKTIKIMKE